VDAALEGLAVTRLWVEIGLTHHGSLTRAYDLTTQIAKAGAHTLKVQCHLPAEGDSSETDRDGNPRDWAKTAFTRDEWSRLCSFAHDRGLEVVASVFCPEAVDLLDGLVDGFKVPSGQICNGLLWQRLEMVSVPLAASYGMRDPYEWERYIPPDHTRLHCVSKYPTPLNEMGWNRMGEMAEWSRTWGLSDHSGTIWPSLMAATLGASVVEVHATVDIDAVGPDFESSLGLRKIELIADGLKAIDQIRNSGEWSPAVDLRSIYEPRWFPEENRFRKSKHGEPPERWWEKER
jgi:N,N'-diacetyllegionaminate synthase